MTEKETYERPLACSACSKKIEVKYTEVDETIKQCYYMCSQCPVLEQFLFQEEERDYQVSSNLTCGHCNTSLKDIQHGESLGCSDCYVTFESFILKELKDTLPIIQEGVNLCHQGHKPGELKEINPSLKILALNEALTQTLNEEDYEQAAWIRDQIQELKKKMKGI